MAHSRYLSISKNCLTEVSGKALQKWVTHRRLNILIQSHLVKNKSKQKIWAGVLPHDGIAQPIEKGLQWNHSIRALERARGKAYTEANWAPESAHVSSIGIFESTTSLHHPYYALVAKTLKPSLQHQLQVSPAHR